MTRAPVAAVALIASAILLAGSIVLADRPRVLIVGPSLTHPVVTRVRDELTVLGFDVRVEVDTARDFVTIARGSGASAAARIDASSAAIDLWVDSTPAPAMESLRDAQPALLALRAVELLRARLLPVPPVAPKPVAPKSVATPPVARALPPPAPARGADVPAVPRRAGPFALMAAPALMLSPGGVPAVLHVRVGAEWAPTPRVGVELMAYVPTVPSTASAAEGTVDLRVLDFGGGIRGRLTDPSSDLGVSLGLGLSAMLLVFQGHALPPWTPDGGARWAASPYASVSASYRVHTRLAVRLDLVASLVRPEPILRVAGRDVATFGQPAVFSSLGLEVRP